MLIASRYAWCHSSLGKRAISEILRGHGRVDPFDIAAEHPELVLEALVPAIDVDDVLDEGSSGRREARDHERRARADVGRAHLGPRELGNPTHRGVMAFDADVRAHPCEFVDVEEASVVD